MNRRRLRCWAEDAVYVAVFCLAVCLVIFVIFGIGYGVAGLNSFTCHRELTNRGLDGHFDLWGEGCYVHMDDGRVLPLDDVKPTQVELNTREGADA